MYVNRKVSTYFNLIIEQFPVVVVNVYMVWLSLTLVQLSGINSHMSLFLLCFIITSSFADSHLLSMKRYLVWEKAISNIICMLLLRTVFKSAYRSIHRNSQRKKRGIFLDENSARWTRCPIRALAE